MSEPSAIEKSKSAFVRMDAAAGRDAFPAEIDRTRLLEYLARYADRYGLDIAGWCLLPDGLYLVAAQAEKDVLKNTLRMTKTMYTRYAKRKTGAPGVWKRETGYCALSPGERRDAVRYAERLPVEAGFVDRAENWPWSSAAAHCGFASDQLTRKNIGTETKGKSWSDFLEGEPDEELSSRLDA